MSFTTVVVKGLQCAVDPSMAAAAISHPPPMLDVDLPTDVAKRVVSGFMTSADRDTLVACTKFTLGMAGFPHHNPINYDSVVAKETT